MARSSHMVPVPMELRRAVGTVLRRLRKGRRWNLARVCARAGCSMSYLSCTELATRKAHSVSMGLLVALARIYEVRLSQFFAMVEIQMEADRASHDVLIAAPAEPDPLAGWSPDGGNNERPEAGSGPRMPATSAGAR